MLTRSGILLAAVSAVMSGGLLAQTECAEYATLADSMRTDRRMIRAVDDSINALGFFDVLRKRDLGRRRREIAGRLERRAGDGATLLEACIGLVPADPASDTTLLRWYQVAKLYVEARSCSQAAPYLEQCRQHPQLATAVWDGHRLERPVRTFLSYCRDGNPGDGEPLTQYSGKRAYLFQENLERIVDDRPYTPDELERLAARVFSMDQVAEADSVFRALSPSGDVVIEPPFVLVAGPSGFGVHGFQSERFPVRTEVQDHIDFDLDRYLEEVAAQVVRPMVDRMRREYLRDRAPSELSPVYLVGGGLHEGGLEVFNAYCLQVHGRTCGARVGYFLPYDRSVMVWLSTGGGTLSHEVVHAMVYDDFPDAPTWLEEGLASMFEEQAAGGRPIDNYRLFFVQAARDRFDRLLPIADLIAYPRAAYTEGESSGLHAALARYLALFLHEQGVLASVYRGVRDAWTDTDPLDRAALQARILEEELGMSLEAATAEWGEWVRGRDAPKWFDDRNAIYEEVMQLDLDWPR